MATKAQQTTKKLEAAKATVTEWEGKAQAARERAARIEAESGAAIVAGKSAHNVAAEVNNAQLEAQACDRAAVEARKQAQGLLTWRHASYNR